jgi:hypothetical protein
MMSVSARELIRCIQIFASQGSNPLLSILPDNSIVEMKRKYPDPILSFSDIGIRAYYHCHTSELRPKAEHGHFHIFIRIDDNEWSHLAGLSMDNLGQPLQWFTVNHWVTGGSWVDGLNLENQLARVLTKELPRIETVENWILAMLGFYTPALMEILKDRDQQIDKYSRDKETSEVFNDRNIYLLSHQDIDLLSDLQYYLKTENQPQTIS